MNFFHPSYLFKFPVGDKEGVPVGDKEGVPVGDKEGVPVGDKEEVPVRDKQGVPVGDKQGVPVGEPELGGLKEMLPVERPRVLIDFVVVVLLSL